MSKRKPVLPELTSVLLSREQHINEPDVPARAELRAAEAVIRAASAFEASEGSDPFGDSATRKFLALSRALARLARVTGRDEP